jgi:S-adenosylmethionine:tRNA ribosyltransferase-isomerase
MGKPVQISLKEFTYPLPQEKIAQFPLKERDNSKLLVYKNGDISMRVFKQLPEYINPGTLLVYNDTKVIHARLKFQKATGSPIEIFCLQPFEPFDYQESFVKSKEVKWKCLVGNAKKWKDEILKLELESNGNSFSLFAEKTDRDKEAFIIRFFWEPAHKSFSEIIELAGEIPIPPYLNRDAAPGDSLQYQTVYSRLEGSVAAPTAGFHFTEKVLRDLNKKKIQQTALTLHVGAGTFTPVKSENAVDHQMHIETFRINEASLLQILEHCGQITAVGTTSCRTLESLYWLGVKSMNENFSESDFHISQWEAYELPQDIPVEKAFGSLIGLMKNRKINEITGSTGIMITPGYTFRIIHALVTNFHQPSSTLLMLIAAFIGDDWKKVYEYALNNDFRFLSYGDSSLLMP